MANAGGEEPTEELGQLNHVLVKQLASIQADGDKLTRRLYGLRAAAATATASAYNSTNIKSADSSTSSSCSKTTAARSSKRQLKDANFNGDVFKLCRLANLLNEENDRLEAQLRQAREDCERQREIARNKAVEVEEMKMVLQQHLDRATLPIASFGCDQEDRSISLVSILEQEAFRMLNEDKDSEENEKNILRSEIQRLAVDFVQGLMKVEKDIRRPTPKKVASQLNLEPLDQPWCNKTHIFNYALPAAAASGALIAIALTLKMSSTAAASNRQLT
ncbi:hypothetical protein SELMODRAFT_430333 [Selaginella moellendorffii]|uniref:Uncharacterized protein n=1 Tax=Selaginella moellendorffii TaxID=88036 RepID=D8T928_SELML|nr:hypothetical protein SELMODRAFT_430333 [Selaginella moellendorffii]